MQFLNKLEVRNALVRVLMRSDYSFKDGHIFNVGDITIEIKKTIEPINYAVCGCGGKIAISAGNKNEHFCALKD